MYIIHDLNDLLWLFYHVLMSSALLSVSHDVMILCEFLVPPGSITASVSQSGSMVAGSEFTLTCVITEVIPGLTNMPSAMWLGINSEPVTSGNGITLTTSRNDTSATAILNFNPLKASHGIVYTCIGNLVTPTQREPLQVMNEARFWVQST